MLSRLLVCADPPQPEKKKNWAFHCFHALQCFFFSFLLFGCCLLLVCLLRLSGTLNHKRTHTHTRIRLRVHMYENIFGIFVNPLGRALHLPWTRSQNEKRAHFFLTTAFFFFLYIFYFLFRIERRRRPPSASEKEGKKKKDAYSLCGALRTTAATPTSYKGGHASHQ